VQNHARFWIQHTRSETVEETLDDADRPSLGVRGDQGDRVARRRMCRSERANPSTDIVGDPRQVFFGQQLLDGDVGPSRVSKILGTIRGRPAEDLRQDPGIDTERVRIQLEFLHRRQHLEEDEALGVWWSDENFQVQIVTHQRLGHLRLVTLQVLEGHRRPASVQGAYPGTSNLAAVDGGRTFLGDRGERSRQCWLAKAVALSEWAATRVEDVRAAGIPKEDLAFVRDRRCQGTGHRQAVGGDTDCRLEGPLETQPRAKLREGVPPAHGPGHGNAERSALRVTPVAKMHRIDGEGCWCRTARVDSHHVSIGLPDEREEVASHGAVMRVRDCEGDRGC
jgi:hypothetical protein